MHMIFWPHRFALVNAQAQSGHKSREEEKGERKFISFLFFSLASSHHLIPPVTIQSLQKKLSLRVDC